jgi:hypothetical protein
MDKEGHVNFRAAAPDGPSKHDFHPAADGQLGGILKLYRDWRAGGDDAWMLGLLPLAKRSLDYCVQRWDPKGQGLVSEPHHNTYDIEFWGPESMCTSIYIGALWAMAAMLDHAGRRGEAGRYRGLARQGLAGMERELFNGEYYQQKVMWKELKDQSFARRMARVGRLSSAEDLLLKREGPKYQYGTGCLSDGIIGAWMSGLYGVGAPFDDRRVKSMLEAIFRHNFRRDLSGHANTQRPGYAMGREAGLLLCSWPRGGKPTLPFVYSDEVWTGIEYQVAAHCLQHGLVRQASEIVAAARSRYEGRTRNPFNEYECGSYYARAMASYALLPAFAGFRYDAVAKELFLSPATSRRPFTAFFSTALGWGTLILGSRDLSVILEEGSLDLRKVTLAGHLVRLPRPCRARAGREFKLALQ